MPERVTMGKIADQQQNSIFCVEFVFHLLKRLAEVTVIM